MAFSFPRTGDGHGYSGVRFDRQPARFTRSWTDSSGVHYNVDTTSWTGPGLSFGVMSGSARGPQMSSRRPSMASETNAGLLGRAFSLFEDILSPQPSRHDTFVSNRDQGRAVPRTSTIVRPETESDTSDDDLAYQDDDEEPLPRSRPKSMLSKLKDHLMDDTHVPRSSRAWNGDRDQTLNRERAPQPARKPDGDGRRRSYRTEIREPPWARPVQERAHPEFERTYHHNQETSRKPRPSDLGSTGRSDPSIIQALESVVASERYAVRACRKRLEQATRQPGVRSSYLQRLMDDLRSHEDACNLAQDNLKEAKGGRQSAPTTKSSTARRPADHQRQIPIVVDDDFFGPFGDFVRTEQRRQTSSPVDPIYSTFDEFGRFGAFGRAGFGLHDHLLEDMRRNLGAHFRFYSSASGDPASNSRPGNSSHNRVPDSTPRFERAMPRFSSSTPPLPQPPRNLLKAEEAQRLYTAYSERWKTISPTSPDIPYPARGLEAHALCARDTIWAPFCRASVADWSEEDVMKGNVQAFYLGVVGLVPHYTESSGSGRVEMSFDSSRASQAQVKELVSILKLERTRWHSDRLGSRNGGAEGINEALQKDERNRAVFHAICELLESAQSRAHHH